MDDKQERIRARKLEYTRRIRAERAAKGLCRVCGKPANHRELKGVCFSCGEKQRENREEMTHETLLMAKEADGSSRNRAVQSRGQPSIAKTSRRVSAYNFQRMLRSASF